MAEYWDAVQFRTVKGREKPFMQKLGSARKKDDGSVEIYFNALPIPDADGQCKVVVIAPRERAGGTGTGGAFGRQQARSGQQGAHRGAEEFGGDEIPF